MSEPADETFAQICRRVLDACVRQITGLGHAQPRPGQVALITDIAEAFEATVAHDAARPSQVIGEAGTGVGKSLSYLVPAAVAAATFGTRTVVSTEMISLQSQITDKDFPVVAAACEEVLGFVPKVAVMKGFSNYACSQAAVKLADACLGTDTTATGLRDLQRLRDLLGGHLRSSPLLTVLGGAADVAQQNTELAHWALSQAASLGEPGPDGTGDKAEYPGELPAAAWATVSVSSQDCLGAARCQLADFCLPRQARTRAGEADVVVTNHHLLGVQAATGFSVMIGAKTIGDFDHVVIDEAHGLPGIVRSHGAVEVSEQAVGRLVSAARRVLDDLDPVIGRLLDDGEACGTYLGSELAQWAARIERNETVCRLADGDNPVEQSAPAVTAWLRQLMAALKTAEAATTNVEIHMKCLSLSNRINDLEGSLERVSDHEPGAARWVEVLQGFGRDRASYPAALLSPVDVSGDLLFNVWTRSGIGSLLEPEVDGPTEATHRTAVALSATLPNNYAREAGMAVTTRTYESPFALAYGNSVAFVPRAVTETDIDAISVPSRYSGSKPRFDTAKHPEWAVRHMIDLVNANGGSALILAATAKAGRFYAERLISASGGRWPVLSQWDGAPLRQQVAAWKADPSAVLIGTKSLMTGVDAAGDTCTLVIVDRPARARGNPVDDARVEGMVEAGIERWAADRAVYVGDAGMLLTQSAGRLIRSVSDSGMVAVLDPRLLKSGPLSYPEPTRKAYLDSLGLFTRKIADIDQAVEWLRGHIETRKAG